MRKNKKILSFLLIFALSITFIFPNYKVNAQEKISLNYDLSASWQGGDNNFYYQYSFNLYNNLSEEVSGWSFCIETPKGLAESNINQICNADYSFEGGKLIIKGAGWTNTIYGNSNISGIIVTLCVEEGNAISNVYMLDNNIEVEQPDTGNETPDENIPSTEEPTETPSTEIPDDNQNTEIPDEKPSIEIPNYVGMNINDINSDFDNFCNLNGFTKNIEYEYSEDVNENIVISQDVNDNLFSLKVSLGSAIPKDDFIPDGTNNSNFGIVSGTPIVIDGDFSDWADKPYSYEYNWDNSYFQENYWDQELSKNITKYWYDENGRAYNTDIRHKVQLYCDGVNVYLHIVFAKNYYAFNNGDDYDFEIDDQFTRFRICLTSQDGAMISMTGHKFDVGKHMVYVTHGDGGISGQLAIGAKAMYTVHTEDNLNSELELSIPLEELKRQNNGVNLESFSKISWWSPNLTYRKIVIECSPTIPIVCSILLASGIFGSFYFYDKKKRKNNSN